MTDDELIEACMQAKKDNEARKRERDRLDGELRAIKARIKEELGCSSKEELKALDAKLSKELREAKNAVESGLKKLLKKHERFLT